MGYNNNTMTCDNCFEEIVTRPHYDIAHLDFRDNKLICSPSCLVEWAWKLKDDQQKLSKSKVI